MNINIEKQIKEDIEEKTNKISREKALRNYYKNPNLCLYCNEIIMVNKNDSVSKTRKKKFCDRQCCENYRHDNANIKKCKICGKETYLANKTGLCTSCLKKEKDRKKINTWKETGDTGCGVSSTLRNCIRDYIFEKQNEQCAICGMKNIWNNKELHFILDHIDGDASNNWENNLRLICPNCDSQLDTYKARNKNSARTHRKNKKITDELNECSEPT